MAAPRNSCYILHVNGVSLFSDGIRFGIDITLTPLLSELASAGTRGIGMGMGDISRIGLMVYLIECSSLEGDLGILHTDVQIDVANVDPVQNAK